MRSVAAFVMRSRWHAAAVVAIGGSLSLVLPPLGLVSGGALALVTLRLGARDGLGVAVIGALAVAALLWAGAGTPLPAAGLMVGLWLPVWLVAIVLRVTASQGAAVLAAGIIGMAFAVGVHLLTGDATAWWGRVLERLLAHSPRRDEIPDAAIAAVAPYLNGLVAAMTSVSLTVSVLVGRWWQAILYNPGGFGKEFRSLSLPRGLGLAALALLALFLWQREAVAGVALLADLAPVMVAVFAFAGLAGLHRRAVRLPPLRMVLVAVYLALVVVPHLVAIVLGALGVADTVLPTRPEPGAGTA